MRRLIFSDEKASHREKKKKKKKVFPERRRKMATGDVCGVGLEENYDYDYDDDETIRRPQLCEGETDRLHAITH
ncbi:hypothetical protein M0804_004730 [Polistes exclamans]|nr:hypothetical protein M0804_004730 [Polistes exclamans]